MIFTYCSTHSRSADCPDERKVKVVSYLLSWSEQDIFLPVHPDESPFR